MKLPCKQKVLALVDGVALLVEYLISLLVIDRHVGICVVEIEHSAPKLAVIFFADLAKVVRNTEAFKLFTGGSKDLAVAWRIGSRKHTADTLTSESLCKSRYNAVEVCAEHFRVVLYDCVGLTLPYCTSPSFIVGEVIVAIGIDNYITEFAIDNICGGLADLHCIGHKRSTNKQVICRCAKSLDGPILCHAANATDSVFLCIGFHS